MKGNNEDTKEGTVEVKIKQLHYESTPNPNIVITLDIEITNTKKTITINPSMNNSTDKAYDINESVLFTPISSYDNKITSTLTLNNKKTHTQKARVSEIIHSPLSPSTKYPFTLSTSFSFPEDKNTFTIDIILTEYHLSQSISNRLSNLTKLESEESPLGNPRAFCDAFFIASLPKKGAKLLSNSSFLPSSCGHKLCSYLPAYLPDIIAKYPENDKNQSNFALNALVASLCFPYGIKICFDQNEADKNSAKNFMFTTTNEFGRRNYIYVYNMYYKVDFVEFKSNYDIDPIKDHLLTSRIVALMEDNEKKTKSKSQLEKEINDNFEITNHLINSNFVYIPMCYCLVSKYPFMNQMKTCIESIIKMSIDESEMKHFLKHLIYEIPIPIQESKLFFYIPYSTTCLEINGKNNQKLKLPYGTMKKLFDYFSIENIIKIFTLILFRHKILFVSSDNDYNILSEISLCFLNAIYPLKWKYTYIPVLTITMLKFLQSFVPFIMGIEEKMISIAREYFDEESDVSIVFLKKDKKSYIKKANDYFDIQSHNEEEEIEMPKEIKSSLYNELSEIRKNVKKEQNLNQDGEFKMDKKIKKIFMKTLCKMFGGYKKYVSVIEHFAYFNNELFLKEKKSYKSFYRELISTEMFNLFIQKCNKYQYFNKYISIFSNEYKRSTSSLSTNTIKETPKLTKQNSLFAFSTESSSQNSTLNASNSSNKKSVNFIIAPYFIQPLISDINKVNEIIKNYNENNNKSTYFNSKCIIMNKIASLASNEDNLYLRYKIPFALVENANANEERNEKERPIIDEKKTLLENAMRQILTCDSNDTSYNISSLLSQIDFKDKSILEFFTEILYQSKFKTRNVHILNSKSFDDISKLVFLALLNVNKNYLNAKYITKSLFYYYKSLSHKVKYYLFNHFNKKKPFDVWVDESFWLEWFNEDRAKCADNDNTFTLLCEMSSVMNDLNIELNFQILCLHEKIGKKYITDIDLLHCLEVTIIKQYNYKIQNEAMI